MSLVTTDGGLVGDYAVTETILIVGSAQQPPNEGDDELTPLAKESRARTASLSCVKHLGVLSPEVVKYNRELFLEAIECYERDQIAKRPQIKSDIQNQDFSMLCSLRKQVDSPMGVGGDELKLLHIVLKDFQKHLAELGKEPWINRREVDGRSKQLDVYLRDYT
jgi:hypothetical protein